MDLTGRTFLVTGGTDGIGLHTAESLARLGAHTLVHGRSEARVQSAVSAIQAKTGNKHVEGYTADFKRLDAVRRLAEEVRQRHETLSVLINNAGVYETERHLSDDGFEMTWAVNVLAPFLLTALLLDRVTDRIINVSSVSAGSSIDFDNLQQESSYSAHGAYSLSKLANIVYTLELARRLKEAGSSVTCNCLDPGTVNTKMLYAGWGPIGMDVKDANDELVIATDPRLATVTGSYFVSKASWPAPRAAYDADTQRRLWEVMERQTGARYSV